MAPTTNKNDLLTTIDAVTTGRGTTIGAAILKSIDAIAELDPNVAPSTPEDAPNPDGSSIPKSPESGDGSGSTPTPNANGDKAPEIVVLLTDGANTRGITRRTRRSRPRPAAFASTRSGSGRRTPPRWSARRPSSAA